MEIDSDSIIKILKIMNDRPSHDETLTSRKNRYLKRQQRKKSSKTVSNIDDHKTKKIKSETKKMKETLDRSLKREPRKSERIKSRQAKTYRSETLKPIVIRSQSVECIVLDESEEETEEKSRDEKSMEEKMKILVERVRSNPLDYIPVKPPTGYLQGRLPSWFSERNAQQENESQSRKNKKALRLEKETSEELERFEREKQEDAKIESQRQKRRMEQRERRAKRKERLSKLTDPSVPPSVISIFGIDDLPSASTAIHRKRRSPRNHRAVKVDAVVEERAVADDSLDFPLDDLFLPDIDVNDVIRFEQQMNFSFTDGAPNVSDDFELQPALGHPEANFGRDEPFIYDEEEEVLYSYPKEDDSTTPDEIYGIEDSFLDIINNDGIKVDPVEMYNGLYVSVPNSDNFL